MLYLKTAVHFMITSRYVLLRMRNVWVKSCTENQNPHFMLILFFRIVLFIRIGKILYIRAGQRRQYGTCALHAAYRRLQTHTQGNFNTYCLYTATKFTQMCLNGTLHLHYQSCYQRNLVVPVAVREPHTNQERQLHTYQVSTDQV